MACWKDASKSVLTLSIVNPTKTPRTIRLDAGTLRTAPDGQGLLVAGDHPRACNVPGQPPAVAVRETEAALFGKINGPAPITFSLSHCGWVVENRIIIIKSSPVSRLDTVGAAYSPSSGPGRGRRGEGQTGASVFRASDSKKGDERRDRRASTSSRR